jgi:PAS domain S-box-containing protein
MRRAATIAVTISETPVKFNLKFSHQILLFVTLPVLIQIVCVSLLWVNVNKLIFSYEREAQASDYLSENVKFLSQLMTCAAAQAMFQATKDPKYEADFHRILANATKNSDVLKDRAKRYLGQSKEASALDGLYSALNDLSESGKRAADSQDQVELAVAYLQVRRVISKVNQLSMGILGDLNLERKAVAENQIQAKNFVFDIILSGLALNVVLIAIYWFTVYRVTSRRFLQLEENVVALGDNQPLRHQLGGGDDLKRFDDILHRVAQVQAESRLKEQAIVLNAVDVICALDETLKFTQINPAAELIWKIETGDLVGRNFISLVKAEQRESVSAKLRNCIASEDSTSFEVSVVDGLKQTVEMQWNVMWSKEMKQLFCVAHDISERKRLESLRRELVAMVSHDLRSPMTSMQVTLNILSSGALGELPAEAQKRVNRAELSLSQLVEMVNDFLEIEKLESGQFALTRASTDAKEIIETGCALVEELATQQNMRIETDIRNFKISCDSARLKRVITNLVSNAIKFSPADSTIAVSARIEDNRAVFEVKDQGRGIPHDRQALMFERFRQLELDDERIKKGSGLGLAVCKSIVEAHDGEILVQSEVDKGSTFIVRLPLE